MVTRGGPELAHCRLWEAGQGPQRLGPCWEPRKPGAVVQCWARTHTHPCRATPKLSPLWHPEPHLGRGTDVSSSPADPLARWSPQCLAWILLG
jgi:hypothetical protein